MAKMTLMTKMNKSKPLSREEIAQAVVHRLAHPFQCKRCQQYVKSVNAFQECKTCAGWNSCTTGPIVQPVFSDSSTNYWPA